MNPKDMVEMKVPNKVATESGGQILLIQTGRG